MRKSRQSNSDQITDDLVYIVKTAKELSPNPRRALAQLGLVIFPGAIAFRPRDLAGLLVTRKSGIAQKLKGAQWDCEVFWTTLVKSELRKFVGADIKSWALRRIPNGSSFDVFMSLNQDLMTGRDAIRTQEEMMSGYIGGEPLSEPQHFE